MADSNFVYESGKAIQVGRHGEHDFVYAGGSEVTDTGDSTVVFESGTGLGGFSPVFFDVSDWGSSNDTQDIDRVPKAYIIDYKKNFEMASDNDSRFINDAPDKSGYDYQLEVEDSTDNDYDDCNILWDESNLDSDGYIAVEVRHREAAHEHRYYLGPDKNGYDTGRHDDEPYYRQIFIGRMYEDGTVTDENGNSLGTWN